MMKKAVVLVLTVLIGVSLLDGCKGGTAQNGGEAERASALPKGEAAYPLETDAELTYWVGLNTNVAQVANTMNETEFAKTEQEATGVKIKYIHPPMGQEKEQFNLLLSSGDLPDIISYNWYEFPGGPQKAINDGYILKLNGLIEDYAPNLKRTLEENPEVDKSVKTDEESYYVFPGMKLDERQTVAFGPILRADWLEELGLDVPETMDEWYTVLKAFKEKKGAVAPLSFTGRVPFREAGAFVGAYGVRQNFYIEDGKVKYGPYEPGYRQFLETFRRWCGEGLIDKNIASIDQKGLDAKVLNGETGATLGYNSAALGRWLTSSQEPGFDLTPAKYPALGKGERARFAKKDLPYSTSYSAAVTQSSKNKELAVRYLDYGYSDEGRLMYSFGKLGQSYEMADGQPKYTDLILNNPEGLSISVALAQYTHNAFEGPFPGLPEAFMQTYPMEQQQKAMVLWSDNDAGSTLPPRMLNTAEESEEINNSITEIETFVEEKTYQFIMGTESLEHYDSFLEQLKTLNIDRVLELKQKAYDRYQSR